MGSSLTLRGRLVLALGAALVLAGVLLGVPDLTRVGVLLLGLALIARLLVARPLSLALERQVSPATVAPGEGASVTLDLHNVGRSTTAMLQAEEEVGHALGDRPRMLVPRIAAAEHRRVTYPIRSELRGRHQLGPLTVRASDAFGLAVRSGRLSGSSAVTVLPRTVRLTSMPRSRPGAGGETPATAQLSLHGESDVGVREYRQGDDLRRIHWPSTARTGAMMVRQDDQPSRTRALVLLDNRAAVHTGSAAGDSFEWAVSAAASIAVHLLAEEVETYLATSDPAHLALAPLPSIEETLEALAVVQQCSAATADSLTESAAELGSYGGASTIAVVGPLSEVEGRALTAAGRGLALVIDPTVLGTGDGRSSPTTHLLIGGGWRALDVHLGDRVEDLWAELVGDPVPAVGGTR
ncbi:DUF58 domain-containing protein [Marihabitans asiaticum]|uniref:Uncharacterized protein DUF58 n=1 Tax=Marihabitans asiaticum TaxID=415218 RepID=A0A560WAD8_9MICO|nr:DUF58 domain-containing protein [Marihabitans asiaticum]TWD14465.1 uncharacterized protein DUF58 [Marihabitans asiaticum]